MSIDLSTPQATAAQQFMSHKGIRTRPFDVEKLDDTPCWYFYYDLPEGQLELEVFYNSAIQDWEVMVTAFPVAV